MLSTLDVVLFTLSVRIMPFWTIVLMIKMYIKHELNLAISDLMVIQILICIFLYIFRNVVMLYVEDDKKNLLKKTLVFRHLTTICLFADITLILLVFVSKKNFVFAEIISIILVTMSLIYERCEVKMQYNKWMARKEKKLAKENGKMYKSINIREYIEKLENGETIEPKAVIYYTDEEELEKQLNKLNILSNETIVVLSEKGWHEICQESSELKTDVLNIFKKHYSY